MEINFTPDDNLDEDVDFITLEEILAETDIELLQDYMEIYEEEECHEECAKIRDRIAELTK